MKPKLIIDDALVEVTPERLAALFAHLGSDEQARFFNALDSEMSGWCWAMQLQYVTDDSGLTLAGRRVMQAIGEYSHWGLPLRAASF